MILGASASVRFHDRPFGSWCTVNEIMLGGMSHLMNFIYSNYKLRFLFASGHEFVAVISGEFMAR